MLYQDYYRPETLQEALNFMSQASSRRIRPIAGGTDLMLQLKEGMTSTEALVDLTQVPDLLQIREEGDELHLGGAVSYTALIDSPLINRYAYLLTEAARVVGAPQIQHMGTIGGNLANASPAGDSLPCFVVLDAYLTLESVDGARQVAMSEFITGVRRTVLQPNELITTISFKKLPPNAGSSFVKLGLRQSQAISIVDVAAVIFAGDGRVEEARIALGSVAPTIVRSPGAERILTGATPDDALLREAGAAARDDISPISDIRGSAPYRLYVTQELVAVAVGNAWQRAQTDSSTKEKLENGHNR